MSAFSLGFVSGAAAVVAPNIAELFATTLYSTSAGASVFIGIAATRHHHKSRAAAGSHRLYDSLRGDNYLVGETTAAQVAGATGAGPNGSATSTLAIATGTHVVWSYKDAARFTSTHLVSHTNGVATNIDLSALGVVGMAVAKITGTTGDWITWHRSLTAGNNLRRNTLNPQSTSDAWLSVAGTTLALSASAPTGTYSIEAYAHDTASDGVIQCGSYVGNGSTTGPIITLGWQPQFVEIKSQTSGSTAWIVLDSVRSPTNTRNEVLQEQSNGAELVDSVIGADFLSDGFQPRTTSPNLNISSYIYRAIRAP